MTLAEFLLARIAEDYEVAWGAAPSPWREGPGNPPIGRRWVLDRFGDTTAICHYGGTYGHVLRFDPSRILADCEARRRIVELADPDALYRDGEAVDPLDLEEWTNGARWALDLTLRVLAQPYDDHPDFDPAWRLDDAPTPR